MFDVDPSQIEALKNTQLVLLLGRLLHAEALVAGVQLGGILVPLQITVPDGGEDGRITWENGSDATNFLPSRANFFQCKASKIGRARWKKECWTKSSAQKGKKRILSNAIASIIDLGGSYIGFTTEALTGEKRDEYIAAIKEGILEAGGDPTKLAAIRMYDANEIAAWAAHHPAVAVWLAEKAHGQSLAGFRTVESWGTRADFLENAYSEESDARYTIGPSQARDDTGASNRIAAGAAWSRILEHVVKPGGLARVVGASGLGKSRFVYESLRSSNSQLAEIVNNSAVFADYRVVSSTLLATASRLAETRCRTLLVVDECPREIAAELGRIATASGSELRIITIDTDDRPFEESKALHISLAPSQGDLVEAIIRGRNAEIDEASISRLRDLCGGFPRFAVLAASDVDFNFATVDDIVDRILLGASITTGEELRALQCLCMFEAVAFEGEGLAIQLDRVAGSFGRMSGDEMYEHLVKGQHHDLVGRNGDYLSAQPLPLAIRLALRRLNVLRPSLIDRFIAEAPDGLVLSLLRRWRYLDMSPVVVESASRLLSPGGQLDSVQAILTTRGSAIVDALVHIVPDRVADRLHYTLLPLSSTELSPGREARRSLVEALSKLVFRARSFGTAARLLMRLAANETEDWANNAAGIFKQLFQLQLSGTEVPPVARFAVLDEGLESGDESTMAMCVEALASVFNRDYMRLGDTGRIGSGPPLSDWSPKTWDEVHEFYQEGLTRLSNVRQLQPKLAERCEHILLSATRLILSSALYEEHGAILASIASEKGGWPEAVESVGDWLYFDRKGAPIEQITFARELYAKLFPTDIIDRAILFTKFWTSDIRDPDVNYSDNGGDYEYSQRMARDLADEIAENTALTLEAIRRMTPLDLKSVHPFAEQLALRADNKRAMFETALEIVVAGTGSINMLRGILRGIDLSDKKLADACLTEAISRIEGKRPLVDLYSALSMNKERLDRVVSDLKAGKITPAQCVNLSYGKGLDDLDSGDVGGFLRELGAHGSDGVWTALEVAMMYRLGAPLPLSNAREIAELLTMPELLGKTRDRRRDAHVLEDLVGKVSNTIGISDRLADGLASQVVRLLESDDYELFNALDSAMRHVLIVLIGAAPAILWAHVSRFYQTATPIERNRMKRIIGPDANHFDGKPHTDAGALYGLPEQLLFEWADASDDRPALLVDFYPMISSDGGKFEWHPALEGIATKYGKSKPFREALGKRMRPSSWSGSIIPLLEVFLVPLESWFDHPIKQLAAWSKEQHGRLERQIGWERDHEAH